MNTTRELMEEYQRLVEYGNQEVIDQFVDENRANERLMSMIKMRNEFLDHLLELFVKRN